MATRPLLRPSKAPNLIVARPDYSQEQQELFKNQLRLYFTEIDNAWSAALGPNGLQYFEAPHIAASDLTDQYADGNDDPTIVKWTNLDSGSGFTLNPSYTATAQTSGVFKIDYSLQFANTANAAHDVFVWLKVNNTDVARSATKFTLPPRKSAGVPSFLCAYSSITFEINAGDEVGLWWATDLAYNPVGPIDGVFMEYQAAQTLPYPHPEVPSAIGSITFVSRRST